MFKVDLLWIQEKFQNASFAFEIFLQIVMDGDLSTG